MKKRCNKAALISAALLVILPLAAGCSSLEQKKTETAKWAVYWYLCGSNLESKRGAASADIEELLQVHLKDDVKVVVQTGGSMEWKRKDVGADKLCRFVYNKKGWKKRKNWMRPIWERRKPLPISLITVRKIIRLNTVW